MSHGSYACYTPMQMVFNLHPTPLNIAGGSANRIGGRGCREDEFVYEACRVTWDIHRDFYQWHCWEENWGQSQRD